MVGNCRMKEEMMGMKKEWILLNMNLASEEVGDEVYI